MVSTKPKHLSKAYAEQFKDPCMADVYDRRPPYPAETFKILLDLLGDHPSSVLDAGCGTGPIARLFAESVDRVDAVDFSEPMIEIGKRLPGGDRPNLTWICGPMEDAPLDPPYGLIIAGESLHWMDWDVVFPRFAAALAPGGYLVLVKRNYSGVFMGERELIRRYSTNQDYQEHDLMGELQKYGLFEKIGTKQTEPTPWRPTVDEYIDMRHSTNGFSRERMGENASQDFDRALRAILVRHASPEGTLELMVTSIVTWGRPFAPRS